MPSTPRASNSRPNAWAADARQVPHRVHRRRRLGHACGRGRRAGHAGHQPREPRPRPAGLLAVARRRMEQYRRRRAVGIRPHLSRERQSRHRSWPRHGVLGARRRDQRRHDRRRAAARERARCSRIGTIRCSTTIARCSAACSARSGGLSTLDNARSSKYPSPKATSACTAPPIGSAARCRRPGANTSNSAYAIQSTISIRPRFSRKIIVSLLDVLHPHGGSSVQTGSTPRLVDSHRRTDLCKGPT
jgi:hypothetical protein